jgi:hypothetical protein
MKTKTCPMCQGEQFDFIHTSQTAQVSLGLWKSASVFSIVCLECGFVAKSIAQRQPSNTIQNR